jgi:hypothetical protein
MAMFLLWRKPFFGQRALRTHLATPSISIMAAADGPSLLAVLI